MQFFGWKYSLDSLIINYKAGGPGHIQPLCSSKQILFCFSPIAFSVLYFPKLVTFESHFLIIRTLFNYSMDFSLLLVAISAAVTIIFFIPRALRGQRSTKHLATNPDVTSNEKLTDDAMSQILPAPSLHILPESILSADESIDRGDWVKRLISYVYKQYECKFNVLMIHTKIDHHFIPEGVVKRYEAVYKDIRNCKAIPYEVTVFRSGNIIRMGDGGFLNWYFQGKFEKLGDIVTLKSITWDEYYEFWLTPKVTGAFPMPKPSTMR